MADVDEGLQKLEIEEAKDAKICGPFDVEISALTDPNTIVSARATCALRDDKNTIYSLTTFSILLQSFIFSYICEDLTEKPVHFPPTDINKWDLFRPELSDDQRNRSIRWIIKRVNSLLQRKVLKVELSKLNDGFEPINIPLESFKAGLYCQEHDKEGDRLPHDDRHSFCKNALLLKVKDTETTVEHLKSLSYVKIGRILCQLNKVERYPENDLTFRNFFQPGTKLRQEEWYASSKVVIPIKPVRYDNGRFQLAHENRKRLPARKRDEPIMELGLPVFKLKNWDETEDKKVVGSLSLVGMRTETVNVDDDGDVNNGYRSTYTIVDETIKAFEEPNVLNCKLKIYGDGQDVNPFCETVAGH